MEKKFLRIIDANYNRSREGLRVSEDILRFVINDAAHAVCLKNTRRSLARLVSVFDVKKLLDARNVKTDDCKFKYSNEKSKISSQDLLRRNFQRATESLRVLEEVSQVLDPMLKPKFMKLRFKIYAIEKDAFRRL
ncbi:MAG: thiamine-phosphate pyrophosphorylase [Candidatus Saelkia tenebricola]|nr:thiamine-phosphate pyrophosphorylase [Candidatus Saelkia tenebricola]